MIDDVLARPPDLPHQGPPSSFGKATAARMSFAFPGCHSLVQSVKVRRVMSDPWSNQSFKL
jgi:hypothetical protein